MSFDTTSPLTPPSAQTAEDTASSIAEPIVAEGAASATAGYPAPRTRWAGIVWGLVVLAIAVLAIGQLSDSSRRAMIADWALTLTPAAIVGIVVIAVGAVLLIAGAVGLIRRGQVLRARRRG